MKKKTTVYAFLDTNIFLEFQDFDQIDWSSVLGYQNVCIIIAPITLRELDQFKYDQRSERRRQRSRRITNKIEDIICSVESGHAAPLPNRSNVTLLSLTDSPDISLYTGLDSSVQDDYLIASMLKFITDHAIIDRQDILLVANDTGLRLKARSLGIHIHRLDTRFQLQDEPSAEQREIAQLKRQLQEFQARQPKLSLAIIQGGRPIEELFTTITILTKPVPEAIDTLYQQEVQATEWQQPTLLSTDETTMLSSFLSMSYEQQEIDRYQEQRQAYLNDYKKYLLQLYKWHEVHNRTRILGLHVNNAGTSPATDLRIRLVIPNDLKVWADSDKPKQPPKPKRPEFPMTAMEKFSKSLVPGTMSSIYDYSYPAQDMIDPDEDWPRITRSNDVIIEWDVSKVMHHMAFPLSPLAIQFPALQQQEYYDLKYQIFAENIADPVSGALKLTVNVEVGPFYYMSVLK